MDVKPLYLRVQKNEPQNFRLVEMDGISDANRWYVPTPFLFENEVVKKLFMNFLNQAMGCYPEHAENVSDALELLNDATPLITNLNNTERQMVIDLWFALAYVAQGYSFDPKAKKQIPDYYRLMIEDAKNVELDESSKVK